MCVYVHAFARARVLFFVLCVCEYACVCVCVATFVCVGAWVGAWAGVRACAHVTINVLHCACVRLLPRTGVPLCLEARAREARAWSVSMFGGGML